MHGVQPNSNTPQTSTTTTPSHLVATLSQANAFDCQTAVDAVEDIVWNHKDWQDPLSKSLIQWGADLLKLNSTNEGELLTATVTMVDHLRKNILANPLDFAKHSLLVDPVLERHWTWEKSWFELWPFVDGTGLSPFDKKPMGAIKPHTFALKMLKWLGGLPPSTPQTLVTSNSPTPLTIQANSIHQLDPVNKSLLTFLLNKAAQTYATIANVKEVRQDMVKTSELAAKLTEQTKKRCEQEREQLQKEMAAHEKRLEKRIEHVELNHDSTVNVLKSTISQGNHKLEMLAKDHAAIQVELNNSKAQNRSMGQTIANLQAQVNSQNNRGGGGNSCTLF
jgi:hypothetical protein